jgi:hypothetical protein
VCARNALVSRSGSSKQSGKFFFDLLQPLSSSFVECSFQLVAPAACPINTICSPNLRDFAPKGKSLDSDHSKGANLRS